jgi:hypothetical protein
MNFGHRIRRRKLFFFRRVTRRNPAGKFLLKANPKSGGLPAGFENYLLRIVPSKTVFGKENRVAIIAIPLCEFFDYYSILLSCASIPQKFPLRGTLQKEADKLIIYI